jgi:hypothetical protein
LKDVDFITYRDDLAGGVMWRHAIADARLLTRRAGGQPAGEGSVAVEFLPK